MNMAIHCKVRQSLKNRLSSYFRVFTNEKAKKLMEKARCIDISLTNTELESLLHEQFLIKEFKPKFNVQFKDDKGYPWIKIETNQNFPQLGLFLVRSRMKEVLDHFLMVMQLGRTQVSPKNFYAQKLFDAYLKIEQDLAYNTR